MTEEEKRAHALRIAKDVLGGADFSWVYEDEELWEASEEDQKDVHTLIYSKLKAVFDD